MNISELNKKNICIVGYAREGEAMQRALQAYAPDARITIADQDETIKINDAEAQLGHGYLHNLDRFDLIIRSSGVPNLPELNIVRDKTTNAACIFFDTINSSGVRTIGVTGSKGKSTTANLIYHALKAKNPQTFLMGNIGLPMINFLAEAKPGATFVIELSSYMLEHLRRSPDIAVMTSFFPEHLDRHGSVENYWGAKKNIAQHQTQEGVIFYNAAYYECRNIAYASPGESIPYITADFPDSIDSTKLKGEHNLSNLAAAYKVAQYCQVPDDIALKALQNTEGLPYRLRSLGIIGGIEWVEDSLATAPEATIFAMQALGNNVETLITGGLDRGCCNFADMGKYIAKSQIKNIVLMPDTGKKIRSTIEAAKPKHKKKYLSTDSIFEAVEFAKNNAKVGSICLLSNASPSYNLFKNYEEKAKQFIAAINSLEK